jgi:hypothetical protein
LGEGAVFSFCKEPMGNTPRYDRPKRRSRIDALPAVDRKNAGHTETGQMHQLRSRTTGKASKGPAASETDDTMNPGVALGKPVRVKMPIPI